MTPARPAAQARRTRPAANDAGEARHTAGSQEATMTDPTPERTP
jgi:hypothetical protein